MAYLFFKALLTGLVVVGVSEIAKRSSLLAAVLASLPLTSILAMIWLYIDTKSVDAVKGLSMGIFWMVVPSLFFFLAFPFLLKTGMRFYFSLIFSCVAMSGVYWLYVLLLKRAGVEL